jgi:hypothetical protein
VSKLKRLPISSTSLSLAALSSPDDDELFSAVVDLSLRFLVRFLGLFGPWGVQFAR